MTRDEVLERLDEFAAYYEGEIRECKSDWLKISYHQRSLALRAASELIRAGGWQDLHHGLDRDTGLTCGMWEQLPNGKHRWYVCPNQMCPGFAMQRGFTHYLPEPEPPAREVEHG